MSSGVIYIDKDDEGDKVYKVNGNLANAFDAASAKHFNRYCEGDLVFILTASQFARFIKYLNIKYETQTNLKQTDS